MKLTILSLLLMFSSSAFALTAIGNQNTANTVTVAGRVIDLSDPNVIIGNSYHNNANSYNTVTIAEASGSSTTAQVPVGKKWTLLAFKAFNAQTGTNSIATGWGTGTEVDTNDPVSNPEYFCGGYQGPGVAALRPYEIPDGDGQAEFLCHIVIPANGYPFTRHVGTGSGINIILYYLEEDA